MNKELKETLRKWRKEEWKLVRTLDEESKFKALHSLINTLADVMGKGPIQVEYHPDLYSFRYIPETKTICVNKTLSIISTLHEFGHHLYGKSELKACRFSVWLFKSAFPKTYRKLKWKGHMLKKV